MKNKVVLVTGGAGFVGSHLAKRLLDMSNKVYVLDNYFTGKKDNHHKGIVYKKANTKNIFKLFNEINLDYIFHLGEYSRVEQSFEDIDSVFEYNLNSFYDVLRLARLHKSKLIYCGSSTKFSKNINKFESPYSLTKKINTQILVQYAKWFNLDYAITYFYNVYGEKEIAEGKYATVIAKFLKLKKSDAKYLPVTKPGSQKRRFTHIEDIINGLIIVAKKGYGDNYGIGSSEKYSIVDIVDMLKMKVNFTPAKKGNRLDGELKTSKIRKLGWKPLYKLEDYINKNIMIN